MGKPVDLGELTNKIYTLLRELDAGERTKVLTSVAHLFGDSPVTVPSPGAGGNGSSATAHQNMSQRAGSLTAHQYFAAKNPQNKGELLAVAAKYREEQAAAHVHTMDDFDKVFSEARRNFDRSHFIRDMKNAAAQAGLFNKGTPKGQYQLSYYGQQYVDRLPDRDAIKQLRRPSRRAGSGKKRKPKMSGSK